MFDEPPLSQGCGESNPHCGIDTALTTVVSFNPMSFFYPIFLDIKDRPCVVIGGGKVAERKALSLLSAGARVTVISPRITRGLKSLVRVKKIRYIPRGYITGDLEGQWLAISAAGSKEVNRAIRAEVRRLKILLNVADNPDLCNFIVPSLVERGSLKIAVSTSGKSPYMSKTIRQLLEKSLPEELGAFIEILGAVRNKLLKERAKNDKKLRIYACFLNSPMLLWIREGSTGKVNRFLKENLGKGYSLSNLGIKLKTAGSVFPAAGNG
ncbi:MAG: bifunctional precorrin-2 dehydrogenase/sirohydrochlorin ferrochelatase [Deltaproteobacteria bacterium]|nr:bifunctional precorrin-2 dehydrogenase/sirohydrochlorin ferrochelatase [Deltaproteobacteria bacterium]